MSDWNPETYARFRGLRLRPAIDLLAQVPDLPPGDVVDLGCGAGAVAEALRARFPGRRLIGVDNSPAMLGQAREAGLHDDLIHADAAVWAPPRPPALIYANALCHWLADHSALFPRLVRLLAPGGVLAVQMPRQYHAPSHALLRKIAAEKFPQLFDFRGWTPPVAEPAEYAALLAPLGDLNLWETEYFQRLAPVDEGHPVRHFTQSTAARPFLEKLDEAQCREFIKAYDEALSRAYPGADDGFVSFPFRRLFFTVVRSAGATI